MNRLYSQMLNQVTCGDCVDVMAHMPHQCVDFVLTDPPYLVNYRDRSGRRVANDDNDAWLRPAFRQIHRVLKPNCLALSFYGWDKADIFISAWRAAGFEIVGHIVFRKNYVSVPATSATATNRHTCWRRAGHPFPQGRCPTSSISRIPETACIRPKSRSSP